jgi:hypothetical protein
VDEVGELHGVAKEEDGRVVVDMVPVSVLGAELDRETTGVTSGIGGSTLTSDGRETSGRADLGADLCEELGAREVRNVVGDFEGTVSSSSLGVDDTLGYTFTIEVSETVAFGKKSDRRIGKDEWRSKMKTHASIKLKSWRRRGPCFPAR